MMEEKKKCIGIIFGGKSNEHDVSISSAKAVFSALNSQTNQKLYKVKSFYISKNGYWYDDVQSTKILLDEGLKKKQIKNLFLLKRKRTS